ncbi:MAG TPA: hypothetical protein VFH54_13895 [Mycobacteriales bacterium]|nr:hypothetical protein [Mycobacteriales bacterium]
MTERTWERYGAASGIAFGILFLVAVFVAPQPPHVDASAQKIVSYYTNHRHAVIASGVFGAFATVAAILFIAHLRHVYDRVEHGIEGLSTVVYASGLMAIAAGLFFSVISTTLAFMVAQPGALLDGGLVRALYDMGYVGSGLTFVLAALFLAGNAVAMVRGEASTPAVGWFAAVAAAANLAAGVSGLMVSSYSSGWTVVFFAALLSLCAWSIVTGGVMLRRPEVEAIAQHHSAIAPAH